MTPQNDAAKWLDIVIRDMAATHGIPPADAARALLLELARWFGIDFEREVAKLEDEPD